MRGAAQVAGRLERLRPVGQLPHLQTAKRRDHRPVSGLLGRAHACSATFATAPSRSSGTGASWSRSSSSERPGARQEEAALAPGAGEHALAELAARQRRAAAAQRSWKASSSPSTWATTSASPSSSPAAARRPPGPRRRRAAASRTLAGRGLGRLGAVRHRQRDPRHLRLHRALHLHAGKVGGGLLERLLDRQLERRGGRATPVAAARQAQMGHPVLDAEQLDAPSVRLHVRPHLVERLLHALLERHRVQAVDQQQAADDAVLGQRAAAPRRRGPRPCARGPRRTSPPRRRSAARRAARARGSRPARAGPSAAGPAR